VLCHAGTRREFRARHVFGVGSRRSRRRREAGVSKRSGLCCGREAEEHHQRPVQLNEFLVAEAAESLAQP
jgi:hypothetical protein